MGLDRETFYDAKRVALVPMGFCYPGTGKSGDLPPRPECAVAWRKQIMHELRNISLTLVIGQYAMAWHLGPHAKATLTETVRSWREHQPTLWPLPHPSPRNNLWLKKNPWFALEVLPELRRQVAAALR
jgi:uracil-DNA glycosylase